MKNDIAIRRIVANISSDDLEKSKEFYSEFLGMELAMDMGWILTFVSRENPTAQISILKNEKKEKPNNSSLFISIEVDDVDALHQKAKDQQIEIVYPLTDEEWGVRRFFVKEPNGATINLIMHL